MKIAVDYTLCESNAICAGLAPDVFEIDENDKMRLLDASPPESMRPVIEHAVRSCPRTALSIVTDAQDSRSPAAPPSATH
jgi:ferredoxin